MKPLAVLNWLWCFWPVAVPAADQISGPPAPGRNPASPPAGQAPMTDIHDIKPLIAMGPDLRWLYWTLGVLVLAALVASAWWLWRRRKAAPEAETAGVPPAPEAEAYQMLDALAADHADAKRFYFRLSAILRHYMERRFDIPAAEMTTEELLPRAQRLALEPDLARAFKAFCQSSDPIKFAGRSVVHPEQLPRDLAFVRNFVRRTTPSADHGQTDAAVHENPSNSTVPGQQLPRIAMDRRPAKD